MRCSRIAVPRRMAVMYAELAAAVNPLLGPTARTVAQAVERWADEDAACALADRTLAARTLARTALLMHQRTRGLSDSASVSSTPLVSSTPTSLPACERCLLHHPDADPGGRRPGRPGLDLHARRRRCPTFGRTLVRTRRGGDVAAPSHRRGVDERESHRPWLPCHVGASVVRAGM